MSKDTPVPEQRQCKKCGVVKPLSDFGVHKSCRGGRLPLCKACVAERQRVYIAENRELIRARKAAEYAADPEPHKARTQAYKEANRDRVLAAKRAYRLANPEKFKAWKDDWYQKNRQLVLDRQRARRETNPGFHREYQRAWLAVNRDKDRARKARRRARKNNAPVVDFTAAQWNELLVYFDYRCAYCGRPGSHLHLEHMTPLSRGGSHTLANVVPACADCNSRKSTKTLLEAVWEENRGEQGNR